ncbi:MAG TPA: hypothetical protein VK636_09995 [Gemmatimonadaceae bacterium]|nr:hypothetical protein [Gemmatimonadaceae bacterium]
MRVRIIFRGLTLFTFQKGSTENAKDGDNMGELTAWLVSDPKMVGMPAHQHIPGLGTIGRESYAGVGRTALKREFPSEMKLSLAGHQLTNGVTVAGSFLDYVPRLGALSRSKSKGIQTAFVTKKIVIPSGRIRAREFISWDWHGNTPARVAFMDTSFQGYGANEVIVDIGDDSDPHGQDKTKSLVLETGKQKKRFWSYTKGNQLVSDIEPNTVEVLITNVGARRSTSVFWGLHMETLFDAAGYERRRVYENTAQFDAFVRAALEYDAAEWRSDVEMMRIGHPFPFLIVDTKNDKLAAIRNTGQPFIIQQAPPHPEGQGTGQGKPDGGHGGHGGGHGGGYDGGHGGMSGMGGMGSHPANDPVSVMVCPLGRE